MLELIWIQTIGQSDSIPNRIQLILKIKSADKIRQNYS